MFEHVKRVGRALFFVATAAALCACGQEPGQVYELSIQEVRQALRQVRIPPQVFGAASPGLRIDASDPSTVIGVVGLGRDEMMRYVLTLAPVTERSTRVQVEIAAAKSGPFGDVERKLAQQPAIACLYIVAMEESVASTLLRRPFEMTRIYPAMMAAAAANAGALSAQIDQVAAAEQKRARDSIAKAYADEAAGRR